LEGRSFSIQSEWVQTRLSRKSGEPDVSFHGWYVAGNWVLSGESRGYQDGVFKSVVPVGKAGAWELAVRYSRISLNSGQIRGGEEDNVTFGLNWYFNDHLRLMADHVMVNSDRRGASDNPNIPDVRAQIAF
jgi:phosphate-selective porin OprO and OprP